MAFANEVEMRQAIQSRAYELWQSEGCQHGRDQHYWMAAEKEIKNSLEVEQSTTVNMTEQPESKPAKKPAKRATKKSKVVVDAD